MSGHYVWNITKQKKHYGHNVHQSNSILCFGKANDIKFDKTIFINWGVLVSIVDTFMVFTQTFSVWVFYLKTLGSLLRAFCYQAFSWWAKNAKMTSLVWTADCGIIFLAGFLGAAISSTWSWTLDCLESSFRQVFQSFGSNCIHSIF